MGSAEDLSTVCHSLWTAPGSSLHQCDMEHPLNLSAHQENSDSVFTKPLLFLSALKQSASLKRNPSWFQQVDFENFYPSSIVLTALLLALRPDWEQPWGPTPPDNPPAIRNILNFCLDLISLQIWEPFGILGSFQSLIRSLKFRFPLKRNYGFLSYNKTLPNGQHLIRH